MRLNILALLILIFAISHSAKAVDHQQVKLKKKILPSTGRLDGISNIFFRPVNDSRFQYPTEWRDAEIAAVLDSKTLVPINALRYRATSGQIAYVVDTDGDLDFRNEVPLLFQPNDKVQVADTVLTVQPVDKKGHAKKISYQIITSTDGYTYARISEYRHGEIRLGGKSYEMFVRPRSRNKPQYNLSETVCLIDMDRDGSFSNGWRLSASGKVSQTEEIDTASPFILDGRKLKIVQLDEDGTNLTIESTDQATSISPGFKAPNFVLEDINRNVYDLKELRGKIVFLEFWSTSCPFSQRILPQVNSLIQSKAEKDFVALAIAKEEAPAEIQAHLKELPRNANVVPKEKSTWETYDNPGITPAYYLIDKEGVVRFSGYGASTDNIQILDRLIEKMRSK